jgi:hypothetical protein
MHPAPIAPSEPKSRLVPLLFGLLAVSIVVVGGLIFLLLRGDAGTAPTTKASVNPAAVFAQVGDACKVVVGYHVEDAGRTVAVTMGGQYMNADTLICVLDRLGTPDAVKEHIDSTRAVDGQQTDSWPGYTARWTYYPDDGLQMTIRIA